MVNCGHFRSGGAKIANPMKDTFGLDDTVVPIFFPSSLVRWLEEEGYDRLALIEGTGLETSAIDAPDVLVNFRQHRLLIGNALKLTGNHHLGIYFGRQLKFTAMGIVGYAAMSSDTLKQCLETILKYNKLRAPLINMSMEEVEGFVHLRFDEALDYGPIRIFMFESLIGASNGMLESMGMGPLYDTQFNLTMSKPEGFEQHEHLLSISVVFDQPVNEWVFPASHLLQASSFADPVTAAAARRICDDQLSQVESHKGLINRIETLILQTPGKYPSLNEVASHLCTSPRSLRRELAKLDVTYQALLDRNRKNLAIQYLKTTNMSVQEIAIIMGYSDPANFGRAFRKWTGCSPGDFRV